MAICADIRVRVTPNAYRENPKKNSRRALWQSHVNVAHRDAALGS
jgi:hypothetical protein